VNGLDAPRPISKPVLWIGRVLTCLPALLLLFSGAMKLMPISPEISKEFDRLGWPTSLALPLAIVEITSTLLYLLPPTSVLGAILLTGYMGGAIATHVRIGDPFYLQAAIGVVVWLGLYLRCRRLRAILPLRR